MKNNKVSIDIFSTLANLGWVLIVLRAAGVISTDWNVILNYFLVTLLICLATAIIDPLVNKGGNKGGEK